MNDELGIGDRVTVSGSGDWYEGKSGELVTIRACIGVETHGVQLDGMEPHEGRRWFSPGELRRGEE